MWLIEEKLTGSIIGAFYDVYNELGYGFRECVYEAAMERELRRRGHRVDRQVWMPLYYRGDLLMRDRIDMLVDDKVIVENKAGVDLHQSAQGQLYSYLKAAKRQIGLLFFFGPRAQFFRVIGPAQDRSGGSAPSASIRDKT
ncbi:MAG TPA: GxxExxY protein [Gemmatimonadaceae bacterium]|nr:GxxExxY protein [Gemmatimonadaceae bacterium]